MCPASVMHQRSPPFPRHHNLPLFLLLPLLFLTSLLLLLLTLRSYLHLSFHRAHPSTTTTTSTLLAALETRQRSYKHVSDSIVYNRYARVYSRRIRFPNGQHFDYDIWGRVWRNNSFGVVTIVPFDRRTRTFTLIREYSIAHTRFLYGFPQGQMELGKHSSSLEGAAAELEEEARIRCEAWVDLLDGRTVPQDKYQRESVWFYLCTETFKVVGGRERDREEDMDVVEGVTARQVGELVREGVMQSNQVAAALLALDTLRAKALIV